VIFSRVRLDPASREVWHWVRHASALHGALWRAFPGVHHDSPNARARIRLLHRVEVNRSAQEIVLYAQAEPVPRWDTLPVLGTPQIRNVDAIHENIRAGDELAFRLCVHPRVHRQQWRTAVSPTEREPVGAPVVCARAYACRGVGAIAWLKSRCERFGFTFDPESVVTIDERHEKIKGEPHATTRFDGRLRVLDAEAFRAALQNGVGPRKAYGCGLLTVAAARTP